MRVLVTGADGFIGSHLTEGLVRAGYETKLLFSTILLELGDGWTIALRRSMENLKFGRGM